MNTKISFISKSKKILFFTFCLLSCLKISAQNDAFTRARSLGKGMNIQYLEEYWNGSSAQRYRNYININTLPQWKNHISNIAAAGFNSIRVPICFDVWTSQTPPYTLYDSPTYFAAVDSILKWGLEKNLIMIVDYHHGQLFDATMATELPRIKMLWTEIAERYKNTDPNKILFEIYNEPNGISAANWQNAANQIVSTIRAIAPNHTIVIGANDWNGSNALANNTLPKLLDSNIIYTFHFYDPFIFTHQGASWVGAPVATTGIPYPYNASTMPSLNPQANGTWGQEAFNDYVNKGNKAALKTVLQAVKNWSVSNNVPVFAGEFGAYGAFADQTSRCNLVVDDIDLFGEMGFSWAQWEWDKGFSMIQGLIGAGQLNPCMKTAMTAYDTKFGFNFKGKIYLEGFLDGSSMNTELKTKNLIPKKQPFNIAPWNHSSPDSVLNIPANVVDWLLIVARDSTGVVLSKKTAFLKNDGTIVNLDGIASVNMGSLTGDVFVSVHHKSHLAVMSSVKIEDGVAYDFTLSSAKAKGTSQQKQIGAVWAMFAGDYENTGINNNLDFNKWKINGAAVNQYLAVDADGNGIVNNLDYNLWARNRSKVGTPQDENSFYLATPENTTFTNYTEDISNFSNPERGFYSQLLSESRALAPLTKTKLDQLKAKNITMIRRLYSMPTFRSGPISASFLQHIQNDMDMIRNNGFKIILRFAYTFNEPAPWNDAPESLILSHIDQLKPILQQNVDVIAMMDAGFIGRWGEWHTSSNNLDNTLNQKNVLFKVLDALPKSRSVLVRTQQQKKNIFQKNQPLTASEAFNQSNISRTGHYNDCFLASEDDWGTYWPMDSINLAVQKNYLNQENKYVPQEGETCNCNSPRSDCASAVKELARMRWSTLNNDYIECVLDSWVTQGCYNEIAKKLGYRFRLIKSEIPKTINASSKLNLKIVIKNEGFASPYNSHHGELILRDKISKAIYKINLNQDVRHWLPDLNEIELNLRQDLPISIPSGEYDMFLNFPDPEPSINTNPAYAIRLANQNIWEATTGYNSLLASIKIVR